MAGAVLHLIGGQTRVVDQLPEDAARLLWSKQHGVDASDMGYAALQYKAKPILVNPAAVAFITEAPSQTATFS